MPKGVYPRPPAKGRQDPYSKDVPWYVDGTRMGAHWRAKEAQWTNRQLAELTLQWINAPDIPYPHPHETEDFYQQRIYMKGPNGPFLSALAAQERLDGLTAEFESSFIVHPGLLSRRWNAPTGEPLMQARAAERLPRSWDLPLKRFDAMAAEFFERLHAYAEVRDGEFLYWRIRPTYTRQPIVTSRSQLFHGGWGVGAIDKADTHQVLARLCISRRAPMIQGAALAEAAA